MELDTTFGTGGYIGSSGTGDGQFNTPYDVAVSPDGQEIAVSDSGNHRIQRFSVPFFGFFVGTFGSQGSAVGEFNTPKGLTYDSLGYLYIVDSGNSRIALADDGDVLDVRSGSGNALGQLAGPNSIAVNDRGIYVADTGNNRIQEFDPAHASYFSPLWVTPSSLGLSQPQAIAALPNLVDEKVWVADTGNNRVILLKLPASNPEIGWSSMKQQIASDNLEGALAFFSESSKNRYRNSFTLIGLTALKPVIDQIPSLTPVFIDRETAEYRFQEEVDNFTLTFSVKFVWENGAWKILEY